MDNDDWATIRKALVDFFTALLPSRTIDLTTDLKAAGGFNAAQWRALRNNIERLPAISVQGLTITPAQMDDAVTVHDIQQFLMTNRRHPMSNQIGHAKHPAALGFEKRLSFPDVAASVERSAPEAVSEQPDQAEYKVWYGTSRQPNDPADAGKGYSGRRDSKIHYGSCTVFVPKSHKIGSLGSPWWKRILTLTDDRLKLLKTEETAEADFWSQVSGKLAAVDIDDRDAVIFVHGYNVTFDDAALRAAQIGFDLSIKGAMAFFSWPSQGTLAGYTADEATIEANEDMIAEFMAKFAAQSQAKAVHIIAHSMGNRGVLRAVNRIAQKAAVDGSIPFGQIILAAADVDADTFRNLCAAYTRVSKQTTLYVSQRDLAVESSEWLHDFARVGLLPPVFIAPGIDTVNVTNAGLTALGHGYVASARGVLQDIHDLIVHGAPPKKRFVLKELQSATGETYWSIGQ
ncbi:MAG: alpha/beta fold hydrolase [Rhodopseudomonas sp.]|nr:alpha/beta fold hydrolase [Rhodopseudomonas sp.]